jgi:uncharacterized protein (TIGR04222 family)
MGLREMGAALGSWVKRSISAGGDSEWWVGPPYRILAPMDQARRRNPRHSAADGRTTGWGAALGAPILVVVLILAALLIPVAVDAQQGRSVVWDEIDVTVELREDSSLAVTERDRIDFRGGPFRRGFREIPLARVERYDNVRVGEVVDGEVRPYEFVRPGQFSSDVPNTYTVQTVGSTMRVEWSFPPTTSEMRTFEIAYDALGALRSYPDNDPPYQQISWIGVGRDLTESAPVNEARLTFILPRAVDPGRTFIQGPGGEQPEDHTDDGRVWTWTASDLRNGETLEAGLQFEPLVAARVPAWQEASDRQEQQEAARAEEGGRLSLLFLGLGVLIAIGGGLAVLGAWWTRGRDPEIGPVAEFVAAPPDDLPPGVIGSLLDEQVDQRDIVATMVDLGHRGVIHIDRLEEEGWFGRRSSDFNLTMRNSDAQLAPFERQLLTALFGARLKNGEQARLSEVKSTFAAAEPEIRKRLYDELVTRGYFMAPPHETRSRWKSAGVFLVIVAIVGGCVGISSFAGIAPTIWLPVAAVVGIGLIVVAVSRFMPRKTEAGTEAAARWRAFKRYLESIERFEKLDEAQSIFDRYLPYAIAFGLEGSWVEKFARVPTAAPEWYGDGPYAGPVDPFPGTPRGYPSSRPWYGPYGGGTVIIPGGGTYTGSGRGSGDLGGGEVPGGGGGVPSFDVPDFQDFSDQAGRSLQSSSGSLFSLFNLAGQVFSAASSSSGGGGGFS